LPPSKEGESLELARENMASPEPYLSPESNKQKKLHKEMAKTSGSSGLKKLFSRKNRGSKLPDNAAEQLRAFVAAEQKSPAPAVPQKATQPEEAMPTPSKQEPVVPQKPQPIPARVPVPAPASRAPQAPAEPEPVPESPGAEEVSPVSTEDAAEAKTEFSRFDQGPLADQPAFVPEDDSEDDDDATPPPIARHSPRIPSPPVPEPAEEEAAPPPAPVARAIDPQDRWAQIRKNAAERAAQRQAVQARVSGSLITDDSSEESK
jgi:hypothetical protein